LVNGPIIVKFNSYNNENTSERYTTFSSQITFWKWLANGELFSLKNVSIFVLNSKNLIKTLPCDNQRICEWYKYFFVNWTKFFTHDRKIRELMAFAHIKFITYFDGLNITYNFYS